MKLESESFNEWVEKQIQLILMEASHRIHLTYDMDLTIY